MIRNDFVSNSSSSSYIVFSKLTQDEFLKYITKKYSEYDKDGDYNWLKSRMTRTHLLLPFNFYKFCIVNEHEQHLHLAECYDVIVEDDEISNYNNITKENFLNEFNIYPNEYMSDFYYQLVHKSSMNSTDITAKITMDTIKFTRWFIENCCEANLDEINEEIKKYYDDFEKSSKNKNLKDKTIHKQFMDYLYNKYGNSFYIEKYTLEKITKDLDFIETKLNECEDCYFIKFGWSGEGSGPWIFIDKELKNDNNISFKHLESGWS